ELNAAEDAKRKEAAEAKNQLDTTIYQLEKTMADAGDKISVDIKGKFETALVEAKKDLESNDVARMKAALENLQKIGAELYQQAQAAGATAEAQPGPDGQEPTEPKPAKKSDPKIVDADVEIVDEEKK
ncbi:MAG: Hsp70 family protein, partial [Candidatus Didemnitutus sp.]|nr:Hsp70 family protein [Candidatus Didemnitutus sp.]